ncbi:HAD family hydrolase [Paratractidigestivibacter sp.]|uniref:HAD family hydrolase n=1 Tax=Paratractidigestivibacter sp. TaxID=2847316 RepID=UPI002ABE6238|nr:HAD family hydrolase [Paratractidigestivibacter sp.]
MIEAVLFDMDDTLLSLNLTAFLSRYVNGVSGLLARASGKPRVNIMSAYARAWLAAEGEKRRDHLTNAQLINSIIYKQTKIPLDDPVIADMISYYEENYVPHLGGGMVRAEPKKGAHEAVQAVYDLGLTCALATNPVVSAACDRARMGWAGFVESDFALVSCAENSTRTKPWAGYYEEFCGKLGLSPSECLMVGNDAKRDFAHPDCGLRTIYIGHARPSRAIWSGHMEDLAEALPRIIDEANA